MSDHLHYIKVTPGKIDEDYGEDNVRFPADVKFECRGNRDSKCHQYPDCECEGWSDEHENEHQYVSHDECWLQGWFDAGDSAFQYSGDDAEDWDDNCVPRAMDREGFVNARYSVDEYVEWEWAA